jgi:hypothetical protein
MITKKYIVPSLQILDEAYKNAATAGDAERFAKLAIIELCGWIEETMDALILRCGNRHLKETNNRSYCEKEIVRKTYGFEYQKHFRFMLIRLIGIISVERIEKLVDPTKSTVMMSTLVSLKTVRDNVAHTHLKGATRSLDAPSVTINRFEKVHDGLLDLDQKLRSYGL